VKAPEPTPFQAFWADIDQVLLGLGEEASRFCEAREQWDLRRESRDAAFHIRRDRARCC
jgi:hypothetical protein